jgi:hypothetical protein
MSIYRRSARTLGITFLVIVRLESGLARFYKHFM